MEEPSVLDYLKSRLIPWRGKKIEIPPAESALPEAEGERPGEQALAPDGSPAALDVSAVPLVAGPSSTTETAVEPVTAVKGAFPWRFTLGFVLALIAQVSLGPGPEREWMLGTILYVIGAVFIAWSFLRAEMLVAGYPTQADRAPATLNFRPVALILAAILALLAFAFLGIYRFTAGDAALWEFQGNRFTLWNVTLWLLAVVGILHGFWQVERGATPWFHRLSSWLSQRELRLTISRWSLLVLVVVAVSIFFRVYRIGQVPPEMVSDQAEKLLDVWDVLNGAPKIFFERNTGREGMQMYLTAAIIQLFGTGFSYLSLKIGTVLAGLLTLPYIYLLGKELGSQRIGLYAMLFAGIAYWPNVISRVGLRFPLYPLFVAPTLYYLVRGLRTSRLNDFLLAGLALGLGLHGYTPIRILPFVVLAAIGLYLVHRQPPGSRLQAARGLFVLVLVSLFVFLPLLRYAIDNPEMFSYRSFTRLGTEERPLPGSASWLFMVNLIRAVTMFAWDDGNIWVHSVMNRPALDVISAALFYLGTVVMLVRYLRQRDWRDLFWLLAVPLLMMPSILSLAFPAENPALNRMAGAIVPVFLIVGFCLDSLLETLRTRLGGVSGQALAWIVGLFLVAGAMLQNYDLVFRQYQNYYRSASWNTSEMGEVIHYFANSVGSPDTAWVLAYPHWVDTRLVGINAGYPTRDYAIWSDSLEQTQADPRAKLFLVNPEDVDGLGALKNLYPQGSLQVYASQVVGHNFWMYFVPPESTP
jgi:4-amino-4-deoxy-L-arabinose transferase-like glycosyltransferase